MERGMRRSLLRAGAAALMVFALVVCSNPIDIASSVKTDVMIANNKFLLVKDGAPAKNATSVNPSDPIWIEFDRELDQASVTPQAITFSPAVAWDFDYSARTLFIHPTAMEGLTSYTLTVSGSLKGKDGSSLQESYALKFRTADLPSGNIYINCPDPLHPVSAAYTNSNNVTLTVTYNAAVSDYRYSIDKNDITDSEDSGIQNWKNKGNQPDAPFSLSGTDGSNKVYVQFRKLNGGGDNLTDAVNPISATIILDTTKPTVSAGTMGTLTTSTPKIPTNATASDANGITCSWTKASGPGTIMFDPPNALKTTISADTDGSYSAQLTVTDGAGNTNFSLLTFSRDATPPIAPVFNSITTPTLSNTPTWTWTSGGGDGNGVYAFFLVNPKGERVWKDEVETKSGTVTFPLDAAYLEMLTSKRIYPLSDGLWTLQVAETDAVGNLSAYASCAIRVTPVLPLDGATVNPKLLIHFEWRPMTEGYGIYYAIAPDTTFALLGTTDLVNYFNIPANTLKLGEYHWYVRGTTVLPAGAPKTYFTLKVR